MQILQSYIKRRLLWIITVAIIGCIILYGFGGYMYITGWLWGQLTELLYFVLLSLQVMKIPSMSKQQALAKVRVAMLSRLSLVVVMSIIATQITTMSIGAMLVALVIWKPLTYIDYFINKHHF